MTTEAHFLSHADSDIVEIAARMSVWNVAKRMAGQLTTV